MFSTLSFYDANFLKVDYSLVKISSTQTIFFWNECFKLYESLDTCGKIFHCEFRYGNGNTTPLVCQGCHSEVPQARWLIDHCLTELVRNQKSSCWKHWLFLKPLLKEPVSGLFPGIVDGNNFLIFFILAPLYVFLSPNFPFYKASVILN